MSVVEKRSPQRRVWAALVAVAAVVVLAVVGATLVDGDPKDPESVSLPSSSRPPPASTVAVDESVTPVPPSVPSTTDPTPRVLAVDMGSARGAPYRVYLHRPGVNQFEVPQVFAYIDVATGELRYLEQARLGLGQVVGRFGNHLVLSGTSLSIIDRDFREPRRSITGHQFVGIWRDLAVVAEDFGERTTFHSYRADGSEARSVALVGRRPDVIGGVIGDHVVVERAGRILQVSLSDASVREIATGRLLGVGGDRIFLTDCATGRFCSIVEMTLDRHVRSTPIGPYVRPGTDMVHAQIALDGSAVVLLEPRTGAEVVLRGGARLPLSVEGGPRPYVWGPSGQLFLFDSPSRRLDVIDYQPRRVTTVALPDDVATLLYSVAVW